MNVEEKKVVATMISIYCRSTHHTKNTLCEECDKLLSYAHQRLEKCPFGEEKPTCASCPVHCYKPAMRQEIKEVMRMAGPRMLFLHPIETVKHYYKERKRERDFSKRTKATKK